MLSFAIFDVLKRVEELKRGLFPKQPTKLEAKVFLIRVGSECA